MSIARSHPRLRVLHTSPNSGALDIYLDGEPVVPNIGFSQITRYRGLGAGPHTITVYLPGVARPVLEATTDSLRDGQSYTLAILGPLTRIGFVLLHDTNPLPDKGETGIRLLHASPGLPAVDVSTHRGRPFLSRIPYGEASGLASIPSWVRELEVRPGDAERERRLLVDYHLVSGQNQTMVLMGVTDRFPVLSVMTLYENQTAA